MADRERRYLVLADEDLISLVHSGDPDAFAALYDRHSRAAFSLAHRMMGERQAAEILELAYFSGYTHAEIAELVGLPLGTVKGRMRLGLKKIRAFFESREAAVPR